MDQACIKNRARTYGRVRPEHVAEHLPSLEVARLDGVNILSLAWYFPVGDERSDQCITVMLPPSQHSKTRSLAHPGCDTCYQEQDPHPPPSLI